MSTDTASPGPASAAHGWDDDVLPGSSFVARVAQRLEAWVRANRVVVALAGLGLVLRLVMVLVVHPTCELDDRVWVDARPSPADLAAVQGPRADKSCFVLGGDAFYLFIQGKLIADGELYASPLDYAAYDRTSPGAAKPPLYPAMVAGLHLMGFDTVTSSRVANGVLGALTVLAVGVLARHLAGRRAAALAAGLAAVYPMMLINDWRGLQDGTAALPLVLTAMAAYRFVREPSPRSAALVGVGLAASTFLRSELSILLILLVVPLVWGLGSLVWKARLRLGLVVVAAYALCLAPWTTFNLARFHEVTPLTVGTGSAMLNGSCDSAWYGRYTGWLDFECFTLQSFIALESARASETDYDESDLDKAYRDIATDYVGANVQRFPVVALARVGRVWDLYRPQQNLDLNVAIEGRGTWDSRLGMVQYYLMAPFAGLAVVALARRRTPLAPVVAPFAAVTFAAVLTFGITRFRGPVEPFLALLAGIGLDAALRWSGDRRLAALDGVGDDAVPWPAAAQLGPPPSPAWWERLRDEAQVRQRASMGAGVVAVVAVMAIALGFAADPVSTQAGRTNLAQACAAVHEEGLDDLKVYGGLGPDTVGGVLAAFERARPVAPPAWLPTIDTIVGYLDDLQASGVSGGDWLRGLSQDDRVTLFAAAGRLLSDYSAVCGEPGSTPSVPPSEGPGGLLGPGSA
jgi:hypothetical protein